MSIPAAGEASPSTAQALEAIATIRAHAEGRLSKHQRVLEGFTASLARPRTLYLLVGGCSLWILASLWQKSHGIDPYDPPPFFWLQGVIGFSALLMTTLVLVTQNRQSRNAEERAQLDLQVNLLSEQKVAKLISLIEELRRDLPNVHNRVDLVAESMQQAVDPQVVLTALLKAEPDLPEEEEDPSAEGR